jgi:hypothetical protein
MQTYGRKLVAWFSAVAMILGLTATAVALAPAALADGGVSRIQISKLQDTFDVSSPSSSTTYRGVGDARDSAVPMTVTFTNVNLASTQLSDATLTGVVSSGLYGTPSSLPTGWSIAAGAFRAPV